MSVIRRYNVNIDQSTFDQIDKRIQHYLSQKDKVNLTSIEWFRLTVIFLYPESKLSPKTANLLLQTCLENIKKRFYDVKIKNDKHQRELCLK